MWRARARGAPASKTEQDGAREGSYNVHHGMCTMAPACEREGRGLFTEADFQVVRMVAVNGTHGLPDDALPAR